MTEIAIEELKFTYPSGVQALDGVTLHIQAGERVAIIGQNGAGKTTLVKHLNGLLLPTSGTVRVGEWNTRQRSVAQLAAVVGYVFQNPDDQLFQSTVRAEVTFGPRNLGWETARIDASAQAALEMVRLGAAADRHPYDLAYGERKWVALAAVLAMHPPVLVLDEPTTGQDAAGVELAGEIVERLAVENRTIIAISHDIDFCAEHFDRVVVMAQGKVLVDGPSRSILAQESLLAQTFVEPPQLIRLAHRLGKDWAPLTVEEFVDLLVKSTA